MYLFCVLILLNCSGCLDIGTGRSISISDSPLLLILFNGYFFELFESINGDQSTRVDLQICVLRSGV